MKVLHLLNGDATATVMEQAGLEGDVAVWREMLCEGPTVKDVGSADFWQTREQYFNSIGINNYREYFGSQWQTIECFNEYDEVILWFEFDLFCQINMIAALHYLAGHREDGTKISLVCVGAEPGYDKLMGLSELPAKDYASLKFHRWELEPVHLEQASGVWQAYNNPDLAKLVPWQYEVDKRVFKYLPAAIKKHLERFPSSLNGLNEIEQQMLELIATGEHTSRSIIGAMLQWQTWQGFGDVQYELMLDQLKAFVTAGDTLSLNNSGRTLLAATEPKLIIEPDTIWGAARKADYLWDTDYGIVRVD